MVAKDIDYKTLKESNRKFAKLLIKHNIKPSNDINESDLKFAKNCDYLLTHKKTLNNLTEFTNNIKSASDYIVENRKLNENKVDGMSLIDFADNTPNFNQYPDLAPDHNYNFNNNYNNQFRP